MGFPGCRVQSALCFLKGRTSSFSSIFAVCLDTAMSRQDNFFLVRVCSSLDEIYALMLILSEPWIFFYFRSIMSFSYSLNIVFLLVGFFFFPLYL